MKASPAPHLSSVLMSFHDIACENNNLGRKQGFPQMICPSTHDLTKLHTELLKKNSGSAGSGLKATLPC